MELERLPNVRLRQLKGMAQRLEPILKLGKAGMSDGFVQSLNESLEQHELVKIKFTDFKEEKKELSPRLAERTRSHIVMRVGNVLVLYRENQDAEKRKVRFD